MRLCPFDHTPFRECGHADLGQVEQDLREIYLRINTMSTASAGQAGEDGRRPAAALVADEE